MVEKIDDLFENHYFRERMLNGDAITNYLKLNRMENIDLYHLFNDIFHRI